MKLNPSFVSEVSPKLFFSLDQYFEMFYWNPVRTVLWTRSSQSVPYELVSSGRNVLLLHGYVFGLHLALKTVYELLDHSVVSQMTEDEHCEILKFSSFRNVPINFVIFGICNSLINSWSVQSCSCNTIKTIKGHRMKIIQTVCSI
jgi:hypothetical protein